MLDQFSRTTMLLGQDKMKLLFNSKVAVFGVGGVGGYCAEALARSGIGSIALFDDDRVCLSNINRQIIATHSTIGKYKAQVMRDRIIDINPKAEVSAFCTFYGPETADDIDLSQYDYIIDAVDTVTAKLELISRATTCGTPIISSMGAANKLDPTAFEVSDIYDTTMCPLARVMRRELRKREIKSLKVVYSREAAITPIDDMNSNSSAHCICAPDTTRKERRKVPASIAFVPSVAGLILAGEVIKDLTLR